MASLRKNYKLYYILTIIGGFLLNMPDGGMWTWANMSVYVLSYMKEQGVSQSELESPWLFSLFLMTQALGMLVAGFVKRMVGRRMALLIGILCLDGGLFLSCYAVRHSMYALSFTNGALCGLGFGLIFTIVWLYIIEWANEDEGLISGIVTASTTIGATMIIQVVSNFINPDNKTPEIRVGPLTYFGQLDVVERVPDAYLIIGTYSLIAHILGFLLVRDKPDGTSNETSQLDSKLSTDENRRLSLSNSNLPKTYYSEQSEDVSQLFNGDQNISPSPHNKFALESDVQTLNMTALSSLNGDITQTSSGVVAKDDAKKPQATSYNYTPLEVLRDVRLYILWFIIMCNEFGFVVFNNYYKSFGELFIKSDKSLTDMSATITGSVTVAKILWGLVIDKFGIKWVLILFSSLFSFLYCYIYFTPLLSPYLYYFWVISLACVDIGLYSNYSIAALKIYGQKYFTYNLGLIMMATIFINFAAPPIIHSVLHQLGWFYLFIIIGIGNFISLILTIIFVPLL